MNDICAIILAAGKGVRMRSKKAKVLHPLLGRPMIRYPLDAARKAGAGKLAVVVGHQSEEVVEAVSAPDVKVVLQPAQLGTADAVSKAKAALEGFSGTALILCGDVPLLNGETLKKLLAAHHGADALVTVLSMTPPSAKGYGRLLREGGALKAIVEEKDADEETRAINEVNSGTYAVSLPWLWDALSGIDSKNSQGEFYLTDIVARAAALGRVQSVLMDDWSEGQGINSREQLAQANDAMRQRINRRWMEEGVTLEDPATAWIEPGVVLAEDVTIGPSCRIEGTTTVGAGTRIDAGAIITDSVLGENVHIKPYSVVNQARLGNGVEAGPFAHLRPQAELMENVRVGNFVEVKKSKLYPGVKANHLTYLGDATVGEGTNIGAGTITCNYDGKNKHQTLIGRKAFIGSNTSLVAPVKVGDGAVVGAGSTITRDVPDGALGVTRAKQQTVENWTLKTGPKSREE